MEMRMRCLRDAVKVFLSSIGMVSFMLLFISCVENESYLPAGVFILLFMVYLLLFVRNASVITIDGRGIRRSLFGRITVCYAWEDVREAGLINGRLAYFSKALLTDEERIRINYNGPTRDMITFRSSKKAVERAELFWNRREKQFLKCEIGRPQYR